MNSHFSKDIYQKQLVKKIELVKQSLSQFNVPNFSVYPSPISHFRMRAEFRMWHSGEDLYHIMYDPVTKVRAQVSDFPIATHLINDTMQAIIPLLKYSHELRHLLFRIDYLSTLSGQILVSLIYHKRLTIAWEKEAINIKNILNSQGLNLQLIGRSANQKIMLDHDYVDEELSILGKTYYYRQVENSFTQPNAAVNIKMLEWVTTLVKYKRGDLLEFYCGNGNFSIALAQNFKSVLATEIAKSSVRAAEYNIQKNKVTNLHVIRLSAEEFTAAINNERQFKRLRHIDLNAYHCNTVLVDPPRAGLDEKTLFMLKHYQTIVYISCNIVTLCSNLQTLSKTHRIAHLAMFDQFPYTSHVEIGVILIKMD